MQLSFPTALALLGAGYYAFTRVQRPSVDVPMTADDLQKLERWHEHMAGARFALVVGLAGAGLLHWVSRPGAGARRSRFERFERTSLP